ncbi:DNA-dependent protein kinase catalytic subunit-like [Anopheles cruzii]|uniref:DNA-dependent protein kinase catalytic subunit-like n=1 Tax=Anopheles cruzii TaxID=68878 RepID=UPI0022EC5021|nr:DNA-dependent protein kinase catalytic subunit-like [Anopheles cruzii]
MSSTELESCFKQLKSCLDKRQVVVARNIIDRITKLLIESPTESRSEVEYHLELVFGDGTGLVAFLEQSFGNAKLFTKANEDCFDLCRKTIAKHSSLVRKWMDRLVAVSLRYIRSSSMMARERELAALVLQDCISYGCLVPESYTKLGTLVDELLPVFEQRKPPNRFRQNLFELLGQLAKRFPECVRQPDRLRDVFLSAAESQLLEENYPSLVSLAGAIRGLDLFLFNFAPSAGDQELRQRMYLLVKKLSLWDESRSERLVFRSALQLVANHGALFTEYLYTDHAHWQKSLGGNWIKSNNRDDQLVGLAALYAFYGELARVLSREDPSGADDNEQRRTKVNVLSQYLAHYRKLLNSPATDRLEVRVAIRGFGLMAGPCHRLSGASVSLDELLTTVLERIECICGRSSTAGSMLEDLPDFVQSLSEILTHLEGLTGVQIVSLQTMTIALIRDFYHLSTVHHKLIVRSLRSTLENIRKLGGNVLDQLLDNVLLQGIIWSCSHALPYGPPSSSGDASGQQIDWKQEMVTYRNYLPLWSGLLEKHDAEDESLLGSIYRALMRTLFVMVEKLNLSTRKRTFGDEDGTVRELFFCDPNIDLEPVVPKDFHMFLNLVELFRALLHGSEAHDGRFLEWTRTYFELFVKRSLAHPLVSGFVKLIELGLEIAERIGYFRRMNDFDSRSTGLLLVAYIERTIQTALHASGELQLACLRFVLNVPARFLVEFIDDQEQQQPLMVAVFRAAFLLGRGIHSVARTALGCLQRLVLYRDPPLHMEQRQQFLRQVLPLLEPYLLVRDSARAASSTVTDRRLVRFHRQRTVNLAPGKIERIKQQHRFQQATDVGELMTLQLQILNFLAVLQPNECGWLVAEGAGDGSETVKGMEEAEVQTQGTTASLVRWDADNERSIELRLLAASGTRPCFKLDGVIGRMCRLAVESTDRATKLAACELLHTIILYLLGIHYQDQLTGLWSDLCHHLLQLSCDTDLAVCQMFEPLLFQIIHYVTQPSKVGQSGTMVLLDCLLNATGSGQNTAVRDLAVRSLREFLQWTNRQSGGAASANERRLIKVTLLDRLKTYAMESNPSRRYGAALAFNNLFRLLAQEDYHLVRYWVELVHAYATGFVMTEDQAALAVGGAQSVAGDGDALDQFARALEHLAKVLASRKALFNVPPTELIHPEFRQIVPPAIDGAGRLKDVVRWLFQQCVARQRHYRRQCMKLFLRLAPLVRDVTSVTDFVKHFSPDEIETICLQADKDQGIGRAATLEALRNQRTVSVVTNGYLWLEYLHASLDFACWLLRDGLLPDESYRVVLTRLLPVVRYFLQSVVNLSLYELMQRIDPQTSERTHADSFELRMNADKIVRFDTLRATLVGQVVELLVLLADEEKTTGTLRPLTTATLWENRSTFVFLLKLVFESQTYGLDCAIPVNRELESGRNELWHRVDALIRFLCEHPSDSIKIPIVSVLTERLITVTEDVASRITALLQQQTVNEDDQKAAKGILFLAQHRSALLMQPDGGAADRERFRTAARKILTDSYDAIGQGGVQRTLTPSAARFATIVLRAAYRISAEMDPELVQRTIVCCLADDPLRSNVPHGQHFLACYGPAVFELFLTRSADCLPKLLGSLVVENFATIVRLLCELMDYAYRKHASDKELLGQLVDTFLTYGWGLLLECSRRQENRFGACDQQLIVLMSSVAMICPFGLSGIRSKVDASYGEWLAGLIGDRALPIALKTNAVVLLPTVLGSEAYDEAIHKPFKEALEALQDAHFPVRSSEFPPDSPQRIGFVNCLERLLDALVVSRSPLLLKVIVQMTAPDGEGNIAERQIRSAIGRFMKDQSFTAQCARLQELWELFRDHSLAPAIRVTILRRYLCTAQWHCAYDTIVAFYERNIRAISGLVEVVPRGHNDWDVQHALVDQTGGFRLVEQYAALLPRAMLLVEDCVVSRALYAGDGSFSMTQSTIRGQRLIGDFSKRAHLARRTPLRVPGADRTTLERYRQYQCAAYRALVALISNTNTDARMYSVLLFRENREMGEFVWRNLLDCSDDQLYVEAGQEWEEMPRIVEKRIAIRQEEAARDADRSNRSDASVVVGSSLSQEVSRFDLHHSVVLSAREVALRDAAELSLRQKGAESGVPLERTKINAHEVMAIVCGCLRHMARAKISTESVVRFIVASLGDPDQPTNVRLFLAKLIDNCRTELKPHASLLIAPVMRLIVDERIFRGLNTLVTDLFALVLEWSADNVVDGRPREGSYDEVSTMASTLLRFTVKHCCQQRAQREVFRLNLELIRAIIRQWHSVLIVPTELLYGMIASAPTRHATQQDELTEFELIAGLRLGAIVLINGAGNLVPWMESTRQEYLRAVLQSLKAATSTLYGAAAQLLGLALARLFPDGAPPEPTQDGELDDANGGHFYHAECMTRLSVIQRAHGRKFLEIIYEVGKAFPSIVDPFLASVCFHIPSASVKEKRMCLELLLGGRLELLGDTLYPELASMNLAQLLRENDLQLPMLHLLNRAIPLIGAPEDLVQLIEPVGRVALETGRPEARAVAYEILIYIHEVRGGALSEERQQYVWRLLLRGLSDSKEQSEQAGDAPGTGASSVRVRILEYLTEKGRLPGDLRKRFLYLLTELYDPSVEADFLGCAVALLLDPAIRCDESKDRLFLHEYVAADVKFREYNIETGWQQRHSMTVLTPLFAETASQKQQQLLQSYLASGGSQMEAHIRATQFAGTDSHDFPDRASTFEPTQDPTRYTRGRDTFAMPTQNSLLFEASSLQLDRRSRRKVGSESMAESPDQGISSSQRTFERLRKRILRDDAANRRVQTARAIDRHYTAQRQHTEQRRQAGSRVTLCRRYRLADYPDLQINLLAFLLPLQALCRRDAGCARHLLVAIFKGLIDGMDAPDGSEWKAFLAQLDSSVQRMLESSKLCDPNLFGALIELSLGKPTSGRMTLCPRTVTSVAGSSNMLTMGVLYVESKLTDDPEFDGAPVRSGPGAVGGDRSEASHWLQLSILYHALQEHDVVSSIFGEKWDSDPRLRNAIDLEALGRYDRAYRAYFELVSESSQSSHAEERNFCYKSACACLVRLGQWDALLKLVEDQVSTAYDELWTDEWNQEHLLPAYMHGNVRQNLAGDERGRAFCQLLQTWMDTPERAAYIREQFGEELTALQIACGETVRARLFADQTQRQFLEEWHCASVLSEDYRISCLLEVRKVGELRAYSELLELSPPQQELATGGMIVSWQNAIPSASDSLLVWDAIVAYRRFLLDKLDQAADGGASVECGRSKLSELLLNLELGLLEVAFAQNNVKYAGRIIARLRADETRIPDCAAGGSTQRREQLLRRRIARVRFERLRHWDSPNAPISAAVNGFRRLAQLTMREIIPAEQLTRAKGAAWTELFHYAENFRERSLDSDEIDPTDLRSIVRSTGFTIPDDTDRLPSVLRQFSLHCLQSTVEALLAGRPNLFDSLSTAEHATSTTELADAYLRLARYCYEALESDASEASQLSLERQLVTALLPAMQYGSREARQLFPVLLQLRNLQSNALRADFDQLVGTVPTWHFLQWIPQILSYLGLTTGDSFLDPLVLRLVHEYPMPMYFPMRLTLEQAAMTDSVAAVRPFVSRIRAALQFPTMDRFSEELYRVAVPEVRLLTLIVKLKKQLVSLNDPREYRRFVEALLVSTSGTELFPNDDDDQHRFGRALMKVLPIARSLRALADLHPVDGRAPIAEQLRVLEDDLRERRNRVAEEQYRLEDFSPWLADYHFSGNLQDCVELPVHSLGLEPPNATNQCTVRVVKIVPELSVYSMTLRMPVQITVRASNGRPYRFLAKYGEDLRQDQRIQQLQQEITHRLRNDRRCREQRLELRTYPVIPICRDFGLIGWLEGTVSLNDIARRAIGRYNPSDRSMRNVKEQYDRFLSTFSSHDQLLNPMDQYGLVAVHADVERLRLKYIELEQTIRDDTLRRALFDMAASAEAFYRLRMNFGRSLATMNITCWVLGIGDRHLSNIVLERATGKLAGVDFGLAFGAATRDLGVPELVPFRLTPQFVGVMSPMRLAGILHKCHLYTLQCLRDARPLLRACLEVFIREPMVDWLEAARQRSPTADGSGGGGTPRPEWHPQTRVDTVMHKLSGANPKCLLEEELREGLISRNQGYLGGYINIVYSAAEQVETALAAFGDTRTLSTELQVAMLLALATDKKLLGIAFSGWYPWF